MSKKRSKVKGQRSKVIFSLLPNKKIFYALPSIFFLPLPVFAQDATTTTPSAPAVRAVVNSNADGAVNADGELTLREAIEVVNGTLTPDRLSSAEQAQIAPATSG
ncbi:MAG: cell envelope biogenesis protein OmpA, partial [Cyanobacteria bacterium J06643_5]